MANPIQLPQLEEKTETYLLTNKGMEKKDFAKEMNPQGAAPEGPPEKKRKDLGSMSKPDGYISPSHGAGRKIVIPEDERESNFMGVRGKRSSYKSHNQSQGESHLDGVNLGLTSEN